jgi:hypothetical protein
VNAVEVRQARVEDAEAIARVHLRTWQSAYGHVFPPDELDALPVEPRIAGWQRGLGDEHAICFVAGDPILGFVFAEPSADEAQIGSTSRCSSSSRPQPAVELDHRHGHRVRRRVRPR